MEKCKCCINTSEMENITIVDGRCNECIEFDNIKRIFSCKNVLKIAFEKIVQKCCLTDKKYSAVVGLSGGTDSTYMLLMLVTKYKMKVKAITFDNGYLSDQAKRNIDNTVKALQVDHEYIHFNQKFLKETYKLSIEKTGAPCLGCSFAMYIAIHDYAWVNDIPYIFHGRSRAQMFGKCLPSNDKQPFDKLYCENKLYIDLVRQFYHWESVKVPYFGFYFYHDISKIEMQDAIRRELVWNVVYQNGLEKEHFDCEYHESAKIMFKKKNGYDIDFHEQNYAIRMEV